MKLIVRVGEMLWLKTGTTHYHAKLGVLDKGRAIKELVVYWVLPYLIPWAIERVTLQFKRRESSSSNIKKTSILYPLNVNILEYKLI